MVRLPSRSREWSRAVSRKLSRAFFRLKESMPRASLSSSGMNWSETPPSGTVPSFNPVRIRCFSGRKWTSIQPRESSTAWAFLLFLTRSG